MGPVASTVHALSEDWIPVPPSLQTSIVHQTLEPNNIRRAYTDSVTQKRSQSHPGPIKDEIHATLQFICWLVVSPYVCVPRQT
jgi:hypothetical protein